MTNSRHIAKLVGPSLIALIASEAFNSHLWASVAVTQTYLAGTLWFVAGLSIILAHHHWVRSWPVLITLVGWIGVLGGLSRMFAPEAAQQGAQHASAALVGQLALLAIGVVLTFKGYGRER
jgi:hypothetical protein